MPFILGIGNGIVCGEGNGRYILPEGYGRFGIGMRGNFRDYRLFSFGNPAAEYERADHGYGNGNEYISNKLVSTV